MEIKYRQLKREDTKKVHRVALEAWRHTYKNIFDTEFIENFVNENYSQEKLIRLLPNIESGKLFFYVALGKSNIVGFSNIGKCNKGWELFRIYLLPAYIGKGVGKKLLQLGEEFLKTKGATEYFCFVHKNNKLGIKFYIKNNFKHFEGNDKEDECYMLKKL